VLWKKKIVVRVVPEKMWETIATWTTGTAPAWWKEDAAAADGERFSVS
jgi:hypothetical protein